MREETARGAALGTGILVIAGALLFGGLQERASGVPPVAAATPSTGIEAVPPIQEPVQTHDSVLAEGRRVYQEQRCSACHSIAGVGSPRSPLDGVGGRLSGAEIRLWIVDPQAARPGVRKPAFDDLPEAQIVALVAYLETLRPPEP
ncbi:MAG: cytochrome c [Gemmatimonadota bacterium]